MGVFDLLGSSANDAMIQVIGFGTERHKVMANNIANIDTPGYRMRDLDVANFDKTLARAVERSKRPGNLGGRLDLPGLDSIDPRASSRGGAEKLRGIVFHDDNDRSVEKLVVDMTKNARRTQHAAALLRNQIRLLRSVISESAS